MLTHETLLRKAKYDPDTGVWISLRTGKRLGIQKSDGYWIVKVDSVKYRSARLAWFYMTGNWPKEYVDHINRIRNDDRWINIREATAKENRANSNAPPPPRRLVKEGIFYGGDVWFRAERNKWRARVRKDNRRYCVGHFNTEEEAWATVKEFTESDPI